MRCKRSNRIDAGCPKSYDDEFFFIQKASIIACPFLYYRTEARTLNNIYNAYIAKCLAVQVIPLKKFPM